MKAIAVCAASLLLCSSAAAALPAHGTFAPGRALGGVRLGEPAAAVRALLGPGYGVCRGCTSTTWYFTLRPFERRGLAVELGRGRVTAVYTLWRPPGWRAGTLRLGAAEAQVAKVAGPLVPIACPGYEALVATHGGTTSAYYVVDERLWGFGLFRDTASVCR